jgi:hypothetical protein
MGLHLRRYHRAQTIRHACGIACEKSVGVMCGVLQQGVRRGLYRGLTLNYIKTVPNVAIYMSLYDVVKNRSRPLFVPRNGHFVPGHDSARPLCTRTIWSRPRCTGV